MLSLVTAGAWPTGGNVDAWGTLYFLLMEALHAMTRVVSTTRLTCFVDTQTPLQNVILGVVLCGELADCTNVCQCTRLHLHGVLQGF